MGWLKNKLRDTYFGLLRRALESDAGRALAADALRGVHVERAPIPQMVQDLPYADLGAAPKLATTAGRADAVFITARFRSGSTLLWNLFRQVPDVTAYYEPLNERRWFDEARRGTRVDASHRNVADYWREYDGLTLLGDVFQASWNDRHLYMPADFWEPKLKRYIELLIEHAPGRPVLQFNRVDFRLPWLRANFPAAKIVHLVRHPRDQWMSTLVKPDCPRELSPEQFAPFDDFYLLHWARDLSFVFPFLDPRAASHPYQLFYYLWRLSYLFGAAHADHSLTFESLVEQPREELTQMFAQLQLRCDSLEPLVSLISRPEQGRWRDYADGDWFARHEAHCEQTLEAAIATQQSMGGEAKHFPLKPVLRDSVA